MAKKVKYTWYVKPLNAETNATIASMISEEDFSHKTNMWECGINIILFLQRSKTSSNLKFQIFNRQGNGQIRKCPAFIFKRKKRRKNK
jgi:hypothetical protein